MRASWLLVALIGCGPVRLGEEEPDVPLDAGAGLDAAAASSLGVLVKVQPPTECHGCYALSAQGLGGKGPYTFKWDNGLTGAMRMVCEDEFSTPLTITVTDSTSAQSLPHAIELQDTDAGCAPPGPMLCLTNPSFEGTPGINLPAAHMFEAPPWSDCTMDTGGLNFPQIINATVPQYVTVAPPATEGLTYLGLAEGMQASEKLCASLSGGTEVSLNLDLERLPINGGAAPETEAAFLQIYGGVSTDCSRNELLWVSSALTASWQHVCVTLKPLMFTDQIFLRAVSDNTLPSTIFVLVDNLVAVPDCRP